MRVHQEANSGKAVGTACKTYGFPYFRAVTLQKRIASPDLIMEPASAPLSIAPK